MINSSMEANFEELYIDDTDYNSEDGLKKFINKMKRKYQFLGEVKMNEIVYEISGYTIDQIDPKIKQAPKNKVISNKIIEDCNITKDLYCVS